MRAQLTSGGLTVVVCATPTGQRDGLLDEIRQVKSALLYADHVRLVSPTAFVYEGIRSITEHGAMGYAAMLLSMDDDQLAALGAPSDIRDGLVQFLNMSTLNREQRRSLGQDHRRELSDWLSEAERAFRGGTDDGDSPFQPMLDQAGVGELQTAAEAGIFSVETLDEAPGEGLDLLLHGYLKTVARTLASRESYPMLDEPTRRIVEGMVEEGLLEIPERVDAHGRKVAAGAGFIDRLPAFPDASVDSILEARASLGSELTQYRRTIARVADTIESSLASPDLVVEVDDLWHDQVRPAVAEINGALSSRSLTGDAAKKFITDPKQSAPLLIGAPFLAMGVHIPMVDASVDGPAGIAALTAGTLITAAKTVMETRDGARKADFYYLSCLDRSLDR